MSTAARKKQQERARKKREWERLISAPTYQNGGYYEGGVEAVDHSGSIRRCGQCVYDKVKIPKTDRVRRCRVRSCVDALCWQHLRKEKHIRVKPTTLKGMAAGSNRGLFTETEITVPRDRKKAWKIRYDGFYVNKDISTRPSYRSDYLADVRGKRYNIDAKMSNASAARYINACRPDQKKAKLCSNNMTLYPDGTGHPYVRAIHRIPAGGELFMAYGKQYWKPEQGVEAPKSASPKKRTAKPKLNYQINPRIPFGKREVV